VAVIFCTAFDVIGVYSVSYKYSYRTGSPRALEHRYTGFPDPAQSSGLTRPDWPWWRHWEHMQ